MLIAFLKPALPLYSTLTNPRLILDATGLRYNASTANGVTANNTVSRWDGISPGTLSTQFGATAATGFSGVVNTLRFQDGYIEFPGKVVLTQTSGVASDYNFMSYNATIGNLKYTVHMVLRLGDEDVPNWLYALFGNFAASQGTKGTGTYFDDKILNSQSDALVSDISKGTAGFIIANNPQNLITANVPFVYTEETDMSQAAADRRKHYINGTLFAYTGVSASTAVVTGPNYPFEVGGLGNNLNVQFRGWISHLIIQEAIESSGTRNAFVNSLLPYTRKSNSNYFFRVDESKTYQVYKTENAATTYYFNYALLQKPSDPNTIYNVYNIGTDHSHDPIKRMVYKKSTDKGRTWGSEVIIFDPGGSSNPAAGEGELYWDPDGTIHGLVMTHTSAGTPGSVNLCYYFTSVDEFANTTFTDITAQVPNPSLLATRTHGNMIRIGNFLYATMYQTTDENSATNVAVTLMRKPADLTTTWSFLTVYTGLSATLYLSEPSIVKLSNSTILMMVRNHTTNEFRQFRIGTDFSTVTDDGNQSFGETFSVASPPLLTKFSIWPLGGYPNSVQDCIAMWLMDRGTNALKVIFGLAATIESSGLSGFISGTKYTVVTDTQIIHYGHILHPNDTFNTIGCFARDPGTLTENTLITFIGDASKFYATRTALGL